jgi:hypothetical protein
MVALTCPATHYGGGQSLLRPEGFIQMVLIRHARAKQDRRVLLALALLTSQALCLLLLQAMPV